MRSNRGSSWTKLLLYGGVVALGMYMLMVVGVGHIGSITGVDHNKDRFAEEEKRAVRFEASVHDLETRLDSFKSGADDANAKLRALEQLIKTSDERHVEFDRRERNLENQVGLLKKAQEDAKAMAAPPVVTAIPVPPPTGAPTISAVSVVSNTARPPTPTVHRPVTPRPQPPVDIITPQQPCYVIGKRLLEEEATGKLEEVWINTIIETAKGEVPTTMDLAAGLAQVHIFFTKKASSCLQFSSTSTDHDPYIEMYKLRYQPRTNKCDVSLNTSLAEGFGEPTFPWLDHWTYGVPSNRARALNAVGQYLTIMLRPRKQLSTSTVPAKFRFKLPDECLKKFDVSKLDDMGRPLPGTPSPLGDSPAAAANALPTTVAPPTYMVFHAPEFNYVFHPPPKVTVKLAGDLLEGLHDGVLSDGGRFGTLVLSHGAEWAWDNFPAFEGEMRELIEKTFGRVDAGEDDAVVKGWDSHTVSFLLGKRAIALNQNGRKVFNFASIPRRLIRTEGFSVAVDEMTHVPDDIVIEDVVTSFSDLDLQMGAGQQTWTGAPFKDHPVLESSVFFAGGFTVHISLEAGVFFVQETSEVKRVMLNELLEAYGPLASGEKDEVVEITPSRVSILLGKRMPQGDDWRPRWSQTIPPEKGEVPHPESEHQFPKTHRVLRLNLGMELLRTTGHNASQACFTPYADGCEYPKYSGAKLSPFPSIVVKLKPRLTYRWAVIGAGPSGMNGLGRVVDSNIDKWDSLLWIDERGFSVGRLSGYHDVQSMNPCQDFIQYVNDYKTYRGLDFGDSKNPLLTYESSKRHCRLGFLAEPLLKATRIVRSGLTSITGRLTDLHKVWFSNATRSTNSTDFVWSLRVGNMEPIFVTHGVVLAVGADPHSHKFPKTPTSVEIPFTSALNPGLLRQFIHNDGMRRGPAFALKKKVVAVLGAGPSGVVVLHNLALLPEVDSAVHLVKYIGGDFARVLPVRHSGEYMNVTRVTVCEYCLFLFSPTQPAKHTSHACTTVL